MSNTTLRTLGIALFVWNLVQSLTNKLGDDPSPWIALLNLFGILVSILLWSIGENGLNEERRDFERSLDRG